jgi:hypothetical protein
MVFNVRVATFRLIALIVLLTGAADYLAFDVGDPLAPMNALGTPGFTAGSISHRMNPPAVRQTDSQDDRCICCAAGFPAQQIVLRGVVEVATANDFFILHQSDPQLVHVDPPPRA